MCHAGGGEEGERAIAPFRALADAARRHAPADALHRDLRPEDPDYHPLAASKNLFVDAIDRDAAETILEHLAASDAPMRVAQLRVLGGAMARVRRTPPPSPTGSADHGQRRVVLRRREDRPKREAWVAGRRRLRRGDDRAPTSTSSTTRARSGFATPTRRATWERLAAIKARYDPTNLFRRNQNIPPEATR